MSVEAQTLDTRDLERRVQEMYREVAEQPFKEFHFETGRARAERLGYPRAELAAIPAGAIDSFAGVGKSTRPMRSSRRPGALRSSAPSSPSASSATRRSGPHASAAPCSETIIETRLRPPGSSSTT
jgi:hypothetical protein